MSSINAAISVNSRILLATLGSYGDVNPFVGLAVGLKARGYHPVVATSPWYRDYVEGAGVEFAPVRPDIDPTNAELVQRLTDARRGTRFLIRTLLMEGLRPSHEDLMAAAVGADLLVSHPITFAAPLVAEELGLRWMSAVLSPVSFFSRYDLPAVPPAPWLARLQRVPGVAHAITRSARAVTRGWTRPVAVLRRERGLPRGGHPLFEGQHSPHGVLALFSRVLATARADWPPRVTITGAIPFAANGGEALDERTAQFLDDGPPPVVFTLGSTAVAAAGSFYSESAAAAKRAGVRAVLVVGEGREDSARELADGTTMVIGRAAFPALLPRAAMVVHPGGAGTLHQALAAGVPMLVVPHGNDQPDNAHHARRLGVARVIYPGRYRALRVARILTSMMNNEDVHARAAAIGAIVSREDGVANACDEIEVVVGG